MAEAAIDMTTNNMSSLRYFCHQCSQETTSVLPDYTCPRCRSGFIEEVNSEESDETSNELYNNESVESDGHNDNNDNNESYIPYERETQMADILDNLYGQFSGSQLEGPRRRAPNHFNNGSNASHSLGSTNMDSNGSDSTTANTSAFNERQNAGSSNPQSPQSRQRTRYFQFNFPRASEAIGFDNQQSLEGLFQHILTNVASGQFAPREGGVSVGGRGLINIDFPLPLFQVLHGNPGDYAWGQGGLDVVITQLLNQLDGTGPPPMAKDEIDSLPYVAITEEQVNNHLQCTVCMEDFKVDEKVRSLVCQHCYHNECIVPWLQMHATCPVCRKELTPNRTSNPGLNNRGSVPTNSDSQQPSDSSANNQSTSHTTYESTDDYD